MTLCRVAPLSQVRRNRMWNPTTGHYDGETVVQRDLACIRARRHGRLDARAGRPALNGFVTTLKGMMLREEYLAGYTQERRRRDHEERAVNSADTTAVREEIRRAIRRERDHLSALASMLEGVDHEAARDIERARSALFAAWSKVRAAPPAGPVCPLIAQGLQERRSAPRREA